MMAAKRFARINANAMELASMTETSEFNNNAVDAKPRGGGGLQGTWKNKNVSPRNSRDRASQIQ